MKKRIAILTSGGDAPGMNAAVRAVVRSGIDKGFEVWGVRRGYAGLISGDMEPLTARSVSGMIQQGGTFLGSARSDEFRTAEGRQQALIHLEKQRIDFVIIIGGDGSQKGAHALSDSGVPVIGISSTIDNDLYGADMAIGVDTALNIALEAIDRLKVTASSHQRALVVETMGRNCGYLALMSGIAGGAEAIVIPEREIDAEAVAQIVRESYDRGKLHALIVVAEGAKNNATALGEYFRDHRQSGFQLRVTILGHVQRGGSPTAFDRLLATRLGTTTTDYVAQGKHGVLLGLVGGEVRATPLKDVVANRKELDLNVLEMARVLAI
jgi:6-phosphofructokinase 1